MKSAEKKCSSTRDPDMECGVDCCRPKSLQFCAKMPVFIAVYCVTGLSTSVLSVFITSQITTLERQFGLSSTQSGFLMSCNDIGFLLMTIFVSYSARNVHIPRALALSGTVYGLGGLVCALAYVFDPYKLDRLYQIRSTSVNSSSKPDHQLLCTNMEMSTLGYSGNSSVFSGNNSGCSDGQSSSFRPGISTDYTVWAVTFIAVGMLIQGMAKSPRYPYIATYVDDNVKKTKTGMYIGIVMCLGIFGPAIAFSTGGLFNTVYVTLHDVPIGIRDSRWIGAWWLGFVIYGVIAFVLAIPLFFFPRRMRPKTKLDEVLKPTGKGLKQYKGLLIAVRRLLKNPVYVSVVSGGCMTLLLVSGTISYSPKYMETQFTLPTWKANILIGVLHLSAASIGSFIGGIITTKLKLQPMTCIKVVVTLKLVGLLLIGSGYFLGCSNPNIVGYNYHNTPLNNSTGTGNYVSCAQSCDCETRDYFPVCGDDGRNYYSPCMAGCTNEHKKTFLNCNCVGENSTVTAGLCDPECDMLIPYLAVGFLSGLIETMVIVPSFIFQIRSVSEKDKSLALGVSSLLVTLLGWMPGPVIMGQIVDTVCEVWNSSCDQHGSCALYDIEQFRFRFISYRVGIGALAIFCYMVAYFKGKKKTDWSTEERTDMKQSQPDGDTCMKEIKNGLPLKE